MLTAAAVSTVVVLAVALVAVLALSSDDRDDRLGGLLGMVKSARLDEAGGEVVVLLEGEILVRAHTREGAPPPSAAAVATGRNR